MAYVPGKGDFISIAFDPQAGHEQKGRRPALVVSNTLFNERTGLAIVCPVTTTRRYFPFHIEILNDPNVTGFVMVEQVKSIDFQARGAGLISKAPDSVLEEALAMLDACLY